MSKHTSRDLWALVCDDDMQDMSDALGRQYSLSEFVVSRLGTPGTQRVVEVHVDRRIDTRSDAKAFVAQIKFLRAAQCRQVYALIAQLAAEAGEPVEAQPTTFDIATIMQVGAALMRRIEVLLGVGGEDTKRLSSEAFRRTLSDLSMVLSDGFSAHSVFVDVTQRIAGSRLPDDLWIERALGKSGKHYVLVPVSVELVDE